MSPDNTQDNAVSRAMKYLSLGAQHAIHADAIDLLEYAAGHMLRLVADHISNPNLVESCAEYLGCIVMIIWDSPSENYQLQVHLWTYQFYNTAQY